jgi:hypothetical protein
MKLPDPIVVAVIAGFITLIGYFITNALERRREVRIREGEFRLSQYKEFLAALTEQAAEYNMQTHVRFVNSVNVLLLIGGPGLLYAIKALVENYNDKDGTEERSWEIIDRILQQMRFDLGAPGTRELEEFQISNHCPGSCAFAGVSRNARERELRR